MTKHLILALAAATLVLTACGKKSSSTRDEFGGKSPEQFYALFNAQPDCSKKPVVMVHQILKGDNHPNFDLANGGEITVSLFLLPGKFRIIFYRTTYVWGSRSTVFKDVDTHDQEEVNGTWAIENRQMVLTAQGKRVAVFGDGLPDDHTETLSGKILPAIQDLVKMDVSLVVHELIRSENSGLETWLPEQDSQACSGHMDDALGIH